MKSKIYNQSGKEAGTIDLPERVFGVPWNGDLVHQVAVSQQANRRKPVAHAKDRSEVSGGGRKPWRQKGTGRARHGSIRSPLWRGGGATFGPRNDKNYAKKINKKMRAKALYTVLSRKLKDNEILFVDTLSFDAPKAAQAKEVLVSLSSVPHFEQLKTKRKNAACIALPTKNEALKKSFRNFGNITVDEVRNLNPVDVLTCKYLIIADPKESLMFFGTDTEEKKEAPKKAVTKKTAAPQKVASPKAIVTRKPLTPAKKTTK